MFTYIRNKPEEVRTWYVYIGTGISLCVVIFLYALIAFKTKSGSWHQSFEQIKQIGKWGISEISGRAKTLQEPLRPMGK